MIGNTAIYGTAIAAMLGAEMSAALGCTRIFWNTNDGGPLIVGRNEDYVSASDPTLVATPRGVPRTGTERDQDKPQSISWTSSTVMSPSTQTTGSRMTA